jgi:bacillolysin
MKIKTALAVLFTIFCLINSLPAQEKTYLISHTTKEGVPTFITFNSNSVVTAENFFNSMKAEFRFTSDDSLELYKTSSDELGFKHYRFNQKYKGVKVYGAEYLLHEKMGKIRMANGKIFLGLNIEVSPTIQEQEALEIAMQYLGEKQYRWQDKKLELGLKERSKNPNATYYPKGTLVIAPLNGEYNQNNFHLCWMYSIAGSRIDKAWTIFIDAHNGKIVNKISEIADADVPGSATTQYNGLQSITCFQNTTNGLFYLVENGTRGPTHSQQIITLNMLGDTNIYNGINWSAAKVITDSSSTWNTPVRPVSTQVHWNLEKSYDFYYNIFNRNSVDNAGHPLGGLVHFGANSLTQTPDNAFWTNHDTVMVYGDGDGKYFGPMVGLDVTGHEITHGVTFFTAKLTYQGETGALNESFSDIMGTGVEAYTLGSGADWTIGENIVIPSSFTSCNYLRSMSNPKAGLVITNTSSQIIFDGRQPNTYGGQYWVNTGSTQDHGGVHINSGVQNYWFYLLSHGGSGVNDLGNSYFVNGVGIDTALAIAYRTLTVYLTPTSVFSDAAIASEQAAQDFSSPNSYAVQNVKGAWCAVGVAACLSTGINNDKAQNYISIYPNPTTGLFIIETSIAKRQIVRIFDLNGKMVLSQSINGTTSIDGNGLNAGVYNVRIEGNEHLVNRKLVIVR